MCVKGHLRVYRKSGHFNGEERAVHLLTASSISDAEKKKITQLMYTIARMYTPARIVYNQCNSIYEQD